MSISNGIASSLVMASAGLSGSALATKGDKQWGPKIGTNMGILSTGLEYVTSLFTSTTQLGHASSMIQCGTHAYTSLSQYEQSQFMDTKEIRKAVTSAVIGMTSLFCDPESAASARRTATLGLGSFMYLRAMCQNLKTDLKKAAILGVVGTALGVGAYFEAGSMPKAAGIGILGIGML